MADRVQLIIRVDPELYEAIKAKAEDDERSISGLVRYVMRQYVANQGAST